MWLSARTRTQYAILVEREIFSTTPHNVYAYNSCSLYYTIMHMAT